MLVTLAYICRTCFVNSFDRIYYPIYIILNIYIYIYTICVYYTYFVVDISAAEQYCME